MKRQIAFPLVLSITILLLLGGMLYAILAAPTQSSKKLAMTSKHQPTPKITATAANKASAEPTMPNDTPAPQTKITKKYIRIQATDSSLWKYNRKAHTLIITGNGGTNSENAAIIDADSQMDMDDGQRYNIGSFSLDSTAKGRHAANELITKTEKIIIKDGITTINSAAFASFQSLTKITIPNSVKKIGDFALKDCKRLQQITIPASVVKIGGGAFENCTNLYDIKFESGSNCNSMENYPNNPGSSPIQNCKNLRTFQMPNRIRYISKYFFEGCDSLESVSFGKNFRGYQMTFGDENIFDDSSSLLSKKLQKIKVAKSNPYLESIDGILYDKQQKRLLLYPRGRISTTYRVPKGTKSMSDSAFRLCDRLQTVIISDKKLKLHYKRLFEDCKHVTLYVKSNSQVLNYAKKCNINYKIIN
ncbi:putative cell surface protein [Clostridium sp. CAG:75]|jgi:putative surface protein bspA-like|nr:putative cell surface protein [Clostridium sp. CAG:75]